VEGAIQAALAEANASHVQGRDITPFLLKRVAEITGGASLRTNIALIKHNATVGSRIAVSLCQVHGLEVVGGLAEDVYYRSTSQFRSGDSNPGRTWRAAGGVGRNVAVCFARLARSRGGPALVALRSVVANDDRGARLVSELSEEGVDVSQVGRVENATTATYASMLDVSGQLVGAVAAMDVLDHLGAEQQSVSGAGRFRVTVFDCNVSSSCLLRWCALWSKAGSEVWVEPTSAAKCVRCVAAVRAGR
jgi:hypothetical protein